MKAHWEDLRISLEEKALLGILQSSLPSTITSPDIDIKIDTVKIVITEIEIDSLAIEAQRILLKSRAAFDANGDHLRLRGVLDFSAKCGLDLADGELVPTIEIDELAFAQLKQAKWNRWGLPRPLLNRLLTIARTKIQDEIQLSATQALLRKNLSERATIAIRENTPDFLAIELVAPRFRDLEVEDGMINLQWSLALNQSVQQSSQSHLFLGWREINHLSDIYLYEINDRIGIENLRLTQIHNYGNAGKVGITLNLDGAVDVAPNILLDLRLEPSRQLLQLVDVEINLPADSSWTERLGLKLTRGLIRKKIVSSFPIHIDKVIEPYIEIDHRIHPLVSVKIARPWIIALTIEEGGVRMEQEGVAYINAHDPIKS